MTYLSDILWQKKQVVHHKVTRVAKKNGLPPDLKHFQAFQFLPPAPFKINFSSAYLGLSAHYYPEMIPHCASS